MKKTIFKPILFILSCEFAGIVGSIFTFPSIPTWYASLTKPSFTPPSWLFGPVWTILFALMGVSLYLVWINKSKLKPFAIKLFFVQIILNIFWSVIFFGLKMPVWAFGEIVMLWVFIFLTIAEFYKINKTAGILLIPYLAWVSFATLLNFAIAILN